MKRVCYILKKVFFLPPAATVLAAVPGFLMVLSVAVFSVDNPVIQYISYVYSAYALIITCNGLPGIIRAVRAGIENSAVMRRLYSTGIGARYRSDVSFREDFFLHRGAVVSLVFAVYKVMSAFWYHSVWFGAIGGYYIVLGGIRFYLIQSAKKDRRMDSEEQKKLWRMKCYRNTGGMLLLLDMTMIGMIVQMIWQNRSYEYPGVVIYLSAAFAFYTLILAIVNAFRYRKKDNRIYSASKVLNLAGALMSILALQTAMLSRFGDAGEEGFRRAMNMATGSAVSLTVVGMSAFMLLCSPKKINKLELTILKQKK